MRASREVKMGIQDTGKSGDLNGIRGAVAWSTNASPMAVRSIEKARVVA
jgi:hypothetical protein